MCEIINSHHTFELLINLGRYMAIVSYGVEITAVIPVTINNNDLNSNQVPLEEIFQKAKEIMLEFDLNMLDYEMKIASYKVEKE